jgi:hypothetical protein
MGELSQYTLGSGHLHIQEFTTLPTDWNVFFSSTDNLIGRIKGGASVEYTTEKYEDEDDLGYVVIEDITKEKVILKTGVMTWDGDTLAKLCTTARTTTAADGTTTVKIGGLGNQTNTRWVIGFEHKDKNLRVIIVGRNTEGFTFDFKQDSATVIDCQFRAEASDSEGTLIIMQDLRKCPVLKSLAIGTLTLTPAFSPFVKSYTAVTSNTKDAITAAAKSNTDTVVIKNGSTTITNGGDATWNTGENVVTITDTDTAGKVYTYTVKVTKST